MRSSPCRHRVDAARRLRYNLVRHHAARGGRAYVGPTKTRDEWDPGSRETCDGVKMNGMVGGAPEIVDHWLRRATAPRAGPREAAHEPRGGVARSAVDAARGEPTPIPPAATQCRGTAGGRTQLEVRQTISRFQHKIAQSRPPPNLPRQLLAILPAFPGCQAHSPEATSKIEQWRRGRRATGGEGGGGGTAKRGRPLNFRLCRAVRGGCDGPCSTRFHQKRKKVLPGEQGC